jgi:outer membrane protein assembly factor BamA
MRSCLLLLLATSSLFAQPIKKEKKWRISPLPVVYYSPETRLGFGALVSANVNLGDSAATVSYLQSSLIYTLNKQYQLSNIGRLYTNGNRHIIQYRIYFAYFPEYYFGYETTDPELHKELIDYKRFNVELRKYWQVKDVFYAGVYGRYNSLFKVHSPESGSLHDGSPWGYDGYSILGFAPALSLDSRDSQVYPREGFFLETFWMKYPGSSNQINFTHFRFDARAYKPVGFLNDDVLAFQLLFNLNEGNVPFRDMADIGGPYMMRGYYTGYFRFIIIYSFQTEYRFMVSKLFGFAVWGGGSLVSEKWSEPLNHSLKPNFGAGLRLRINQKDRLNLRADYGMGRNQSGLYLDAAEAF